ncbi:MAG: hypothetical protein GY798_20580 [Hyphomicrobiales bacterium]|nr:hypothetical protein [Hyphomicrobiales bacterium]
MIDESEILQKLCDDLISVIERLGTARDGVLLLIDEADKPDASANLGLFCKLLTEETARRSIDRLCIGVAGLPGVTDKLRQSHESSVRLFHVLSLKPLEVDERKQVIDAGMDEAEKKNKRRIEITETAKDYLSTISEGYPHFLQEFSYCAFEADDDDTIDNADVSISLFAENGAFDQLGMKYFNQFYSAPASDDYRLILDCMAEHMDGWVSRRTIIEESGAKAGTVDNALRFFSSRNIIVHDEMRRGHYRLPTKSFAVWISAGRSAESIAQSDAVQEGLFGDQGA